MNNTTRARPACFLVAAARGDKRAAGTVIRKAIRSVVGRARLVGFVAEVETRDLTRGSAGAARFTVDATDEEFARILEAVETGARAAGFDGAPVDAYHE